MITKEMSRPGKVRVTFSMPASIWADTIHLVGDFNNWSVTANPLRLQEHGWSVSLELDAGRAYHYRYLINGSEWNSDWNTDSYAPSKYGGDDSVVITLIPQQTAAPTSAKPATWQRPHLTLIQGRKREKSAV